MPGPGGYWLCPARIAATAASRTSERAVGVGEALAEVDRAGGDGQRRHLGEDRRPETGEARDELGSGHEAVRARDCRYAIASSRHPNMRIDSITSATTVNTL